MLRDNYLRVNRSVPSEENYIKLFDPEHFFFEEFSLITLHSKRDKAFQNSLNGNV